MSLQAVVELLAILSSGLTAGIIFGDRMGNTFARPYLSPSEFIRFQKIQNLHFARMMPVVLLTAIASALAWMILWRTQYNTPQFAMVSLATAAIILAVMLTGTVNVPINKRLETWSEASPPADLRLIWTRWEKFHTGRTVLFIGAFVLEALAAIN